MVGEEQRETLGKQRIQGVIFDLDGTLYSLGHPEVRMTLTLLRDLKILRHLSPARACLRDKSFHDASELKAAFFEELGKRARVGSDRAEKWYVERFLKGFVKMLGAHARIRPGLNELLTLLKTREVRLAVVSDYECVEERLRAIGVSEGAFDDLAAAEDFGTLKPSPKPLLALAEKWKLRPCDVVMVGDRDDMDGKSARAAGMVFIGVSDRPAEKRISSGFLNWQEVAGELRNRTAL